jgi:radical SAM protein with 4Fe4S-binding SPASM domain
VHGFISGSRRDIHISIGFTLMRRSIHEIGLLARIARDLGVPTIYTRHLEVYDSALAEESFVNEPGEFNRWREHALNASAEYGVQINLPPAFEDKADSLGHQHCREPWYSAVILGNGDVMACCVPGTKMGNLHEASLEEIWNGSSYQRLRETVNTPSAPAICMACPIFRLPHNRSSYVLDDSLRSDKEAGAWVHKQPGQSPRDFC